VVEHGDPSAEMGRDSVWYWVAATKLQRILRVATKLPNASMLRYQSDTTYYLLVRRVLPPSAARFERLWSGVRLLLVQTLGAAIVWHLTNPSHLTNGVGLSLGDDDLPQSLHETENAYEGCVVGVGWRHVVI